MPNTDNLKLDDNDKRLIFDLMLSAYFKDKNDSQVLQRIVFYLATLPMVFPVKFDINAFLGGVDQSQLEVGKTTAALRDVPVNLLTMEVNGEKLVPMFTTAEEAHKGPSANIMQLPPEKYIPLILKMGHSFVINPYSDHPLCFLPNMLEELVAPYMDKLKGAKNSIGVGTVLKEKYELVREIGVGGVYVVYLAREMNTNALFAVKVTKTTPESHAVVFKVSAANEVAMVKPLNHPAIPKIVDVVDEDDYIAIVEEYVDGLTLDSIIESDGKCTTQCIVDWAIELCDVLGYLHSMNPPRIYRDMKPANIVLKADGRLSLVDFNIMRTYKPGKTQDTQCLGTVGFAAPEQMGTAQTDPRSDIYSLGMTMYSLYAGKKPDQSTSITFGNETDSQTKALLAIIQKCTQLNPFDRYQSCQELKADLLCIADFLRLRIKQEVHFNLYNFDLVDERKFLYNDGVLRYKHIYNSFDPKPVDAIIAKLPWYKITLVDSDRLELESCLRSIDHSLYADFPISPMGADPIWNFSYNLDGFTGGGYSERYAPHDVIRLGRLVSSLIDRYSDLCQHSYITLDASRRICTKCGKIITIPPAPYPQNKMDEEQAVNCVYASPDFF